MADAHFEELVRDALDGLPGLGRARTSTTSRADRGARRRPASATCTGCTRASRSAAIRPGSCRPRSRIFREPLVRDFGRDPAELARQVRITVVHEIAHHFGIDEDRLHTLGYG